MKELKAFMLVDCCEKKKKENKKENICRAKKERQCYLQTHSDYVISEKHSFINLFLFKPFGFSLTNLREKK